MKCLLLPHRVPMYPKEILSPSRRKDREHETGETKTPPSKKKPVAGRKHYGGGFYLQTGESGSASWLLRYQRGLKTNAKGEIKPAEHWMGLGPKSVFSAKQARARARAAQQKLYDGIDPVDDKRKQRTQQALEAARSITFA